MPPVNLHLLRSSNVWYPRPELPYIGITRNRDPRALSLSIALRKYQCAPAHFHMKPPIFWYAEDQAVAIDHGFFFARMPDRMERVGIMPVFAPAPDHFADRVLIELERHAFMDGVATGGKYSWFTNALEFIEQQDNYGYTGAWEAPVMRFTPGLGWYKRINQERKGKTLLDMSKAAILGMHGNNPERFKHLLRSNRVSEIRTVLYPAKDWNAELKRHMPEFPKAQFSTYDKATGALIQSAGKRHSEAYYDDGSSEQASERVCRTREREAIQAARAETSERVRRTRGQRAIQAAQALPGARELKRAETSERVRRTRGQRAIQAIPPARKLQEEAYEREVERRCAEVARQKQEDHRKAMDIVEARKPRMLEIFNSEDE